MEQLYQQLRRYRGRRRATNRVRTSCNCFPYCSGQKYILDCGHVMCMTGINGLLPEYNPESGPAIHMLLNQLLQPLTAITILTDAMGRGFSCFLCNKRVTLALKIVES